MPVAARAVIDRMAYLVDVQHLPRESRFDPVGWLRNFDSADREEAAELLDALHFVTSSAAQQSLGMALRQAVTVPLPPNPDARTAAREWWSATSVVPLAHASDPAGSGNAVVRWAREILGDQVDLEGPRTAISKASAGALGRIVVVDDILASGTQFLDFCFQREPYTEQTLAQLAKAGSIEIFLAVSVATEWGVQAVHSKLPEATVSAANVLDISYKFPVATVDGLLRKYAARSGASSDPSSTDYVHGFDDQALTIGFEHGWPDATLPVLRSTKQGWRPLWTPTES